MNKNSAGSSVSDDRCPRKLSNRASELWHRLQLFMDEQVYPAEKVATIVHVTNGYRYTCACISWFLVLQGVHTKIRHNFAKIIIKPCQMN